MKLSLQEELKRLEESHIQVETRASKEKLDYLLADDFWEIGSSGKLFDKKFCLELGVGLTEMTLHNYEIQPLGADVVLATYYIEDKTRNRNTRRSSIWKKINGHWQLYFHQGTITDLDVQEFHRGTGE